ncbi:uncharacterized protein LOC124274188 [Haliotis rubra]|uniref:uncharacterized protein LOC124274188 n=1 Tax=Haliotis rubra TaxID=36100 RepID=UPI001EE52FF7|nr:uncharacterized protein LOC124274188 [Haliotis rubra]
MAYHRRLAAYFKQCKDISRKCEELLYHLLAAKDMTELRAVLTEREVFEHVSQDKHKQYLMKAWQHLGGYEEAAAAYTDFLEEYIESQNLKDTDEGYRLQTRVGWFMLDIGQYDQCLELLYKVIEGSLKKYGEKAKELADPLYAVMTALYRKALTFVYNSHPGYQSSRKYGEKYAPQCEMIHRLHWAPDDDYLGQVLLTCGYFKGSLLQDGRKIFKKTHNKKGLAEVLYMLGESEQYATDIRVPEAYFEQSMALCLASFGRYHLKTARCYQLYGQMYWNNWSIKSGHMEWLEKCLELYMMELEILEEVQGKLHPNTVRSREDVIIILQNLDRHVEAMKYNQDQPADAKTIV